jgi:ornithine cyclodeaminase/alanine dehydrogenase-like protein (mu-crystallin family)
MDSASLTAKRTAATTAVAARHLARPNADVAAIVGCGLQGAAHLEALLALRPFREVHLHDTDIARSRALAARTPGDGRTTVRATVGLRDAIADAGIIVTCTSGAEFILSDGDVAPGTFVAAVGADNPRKREIHPDLMQRAKVVVDDLRQCAAGGDLHHALAAGVMTEADVRAELAAVVAGRTSVREGEDEIIVFDSTGIALEDAAAAEVVYRRATADGTWTRVRMGA